MKAKCKKTLISEDNSVNFIKGNEYNFSPFASVFTLNENTILIDEQCEAHRLSLWYKHFKPA